MREKKNAKKQMILAAALVVCVLCFAAVYFLSKPKTSGGIKNFKVTVIDNNNVSTDYEGQTDEQYLRGALEELDGLSISGIESEYGLMVEVVNGISAVYEKDKAYWGFYVNEEYCSNGVDTQPVNDGDYFKIVYTLAE